MRKLRHRQWRCVPALISCLLMMTVANYLEAQCTPNLEESKSFCIGLVKSVNGQPTGSGVYIEHEWTILDMGATQNITFSNMDKQKIKVHTDDPNAVGGILLLQYQVTDDQGCVGISQTLVTVIDPVDVNFSGLMDLCPLDAPILIHANPGGLGGTFSTDAPGGLTDLLNGTALFDPAAAGTGTHSITYSYAENGCEAEVSYAVLVEPCLPPSITITDPCTFRESTPGSQGNATNLENGQFQETVLVEAPSGQTWYIVSADGFFNSTSPHPPANPVPFAIGVSGTKLFEESPGVYSLKGIHIDAIGYSLTLTNGIDEISISNACTYPNPQILAMASGYCEDAEPVTLEADNGGAQGLGQFDLMSEDGQVLIDENITQFAPADYAVGTYQLRYTFDEEPNIGPCMNCAPGAVQAVSQMVEVAEEDPEIACNDFVQVALGSTCEVILTPDMVLEGFYNSYSVYEVEIFDNGNLIGNVLNAAHVGQQFDVQVVNSCNDNYCWGTLEVVDKIKPEFDCPIDPISISCLEDPALILPPTVVDNCELEIDALLNSETIETFGCEEENNVMMRISRYWGAADGSGNQAESCLQIIEVVRPGLDEIVGPPNRDGEEAPIVDCTDGVISPDMTGYPTVNGLPLTQQNGCNLEVIYDDIIISTCGNSFKVVRNWLIFDWCTPSEPGVNPLEITQIIKVGDETPPTVNCPATHVVSVNQPDCTSTFAMPVADIFDDCSDVEIQIISPTGTTDENGGLVYDLELGTYEIQYLATDACGNESDCITVLEVIDAVGPVAICDEFTVTSLDLYGEILLPAVDLNDGSYDYCTDVDYGIKRMGDPGDFLPELLLNCDDVANSPIMVVLQVVDEYNNPNICMVEVTVQDKLPPILTCPQDMLLDCITNIYDFNLTGYVEVVEPCEFEIEIFDNTEGLDICGLGTAYREFVVTDASGNVASCTQTIELEDYDLFTLEDIEWPEDYDADECTSPDIFHPDSLPSSPINYSYPIFADNPCGLVAWNYEDAFFEIASPACFKIVRTWRVIDWCQYDPLNGVYDGFWEYEQIIKVVDNTPPEMECNFYPFVKLQTPVCNADTIFLDYPTVIDCSPDVTVTVESPLGVGFGPFLEVPMGDYPITYTATDNCGNVSVCSYVLEIVDAKPPTPVCVNGIVVELDSIGEVPIYASWFNAGSFDNCTAPEDLLISFSYFPTDTVIWLDCSDVGAIDVEIWVTDEAGNQDFCIVTVFVQDNFNVCPGQPIQYLVAGAVQTEEELEIPDVQITASNGAAPPTTTGANGTYDLNLAGGGDYSLLPERNTNPLDGVTSYDLVLITMHVLNVLPLDSPYKIIAADVNKSGSVTTLDVVALQKLILLLDLEMPNGNTSWRFVDAAYQFQDPDNPLAESFPEVFSINNLAGDILNADFVAVKVGDVNGTATGGAQTGASDRSNLPEFRIELRDLYAHTGDKVQVPIELDSPEGFLGFQWAMHINPEFAVLENILPGEALQLSDFGNLENGWCTLSTYAASSFGKASFTLELTMLQDGWLRDILSIDYSKMLAEVYTDFELPAQPVFSFVTETDKLVFDILPNPSQADIRLALHAQTEQTVRVQILDASGQILSDQSLQLYSGTNGITIPAETFPGAGIYLCRLEAGDQVSTQKIIRMQ